MVPGLNSGASRQNASVESGGSGTSRMPQGRGMKVVGTPLWHTEFIKAQLEMFTAEHQTLFDRIPWWIAQWRERTVWPEWWGR